MSHGLSPLDILAWAPPAYQAKPGRTEPAYQKHATTHTMSAQKIGKRRLMDAVRVAWKKSLKNQGRRLTGGSKLSPRMDCLEQRIEVNRVRRALSPVG